MRTVKDPETRKQEIMEAAMKLFKEKGYEQTSMADIAREIKVVQGLCYRYFPSKQELFDAALDAYAAECCGPFAAIINDERSSLSDRFEYLYSVLEMPPDLRYKTFFHRQGNETFHEMLAVKMCRYMVPYLTAALEHAAVANPESTAEFLIYGQFALWQTPDEQFGRKAAEYKKLAATLLSLK